MATARKPMPAPPAESTRRYFIVNPAGAIHEVDRDHAKWRLGIAGWRLATKAEVDQLNSGTVNQNGKMVLAPGEQRADYPICTPWTPDPDAQIDLEAE